MREIRIYELPRDLKEWLQEKGSSGIPFLELLNKVQPVFVINPRGAPEPLFKDRLIEVGTTAAGTTVAIDAVPEGEIWEVTSILVTTDAAAGANYLQVYDGSANRTLKQVANAQFVDWQGKIYLKEGDIVKALMQSGALNLFVFGAKRFAE